MKQVHMMKLLTLLLTSLSLAVFGQVDPISWDSLKTVATENYEFRIPYEWRQMPFVGNQGPEQMVEASGLALPAMFNGSPVMVTIFIAKQECKNLEDCKDFCLRGYRENPGREFPKKFKDGE